MKLLWIIQAADVGGGIYRHPFGSRERKILCRISREFGGILRCDVGRTVWEDEKGNLEMRGLTAAKS